MCTSRDSLLALAALALLAGCAARAQYAPQRDGSYQLLTSSRTADQAVVRMHRTARALCASTDYSIEDVAPFGDSAALVAVSVTPPPSRTTATFEATLYCRPLGAGAAKGPRSSGTALRFNTRTGARRP